MKKWYVVHTYASHEFKIKDTILKGIEGTDLQNSIGEILIPTQKTFLIKQGKKVEREKKLFNSYIIVEADLTPEVRTFILNVPGVTHFLGLGKNAHALEEAEVNRLLGVSDEEEIATTETLYMPGDLVKVISGPFSDFEGVVDNVNQDGTKLTVKVTVFGRVTPVEVSTDQVEILN
jgi:transcriptional antiterminator NusG